MIVRAATSADLEKLVTLRMRLFAETGELSNDESEAPVEQATRDFFARHIVSPLSRSWVAVLGQSVASVGTLAFFTRLPYPGNPLGREAYLLNMYTLPEYRRQGLATAILSCAMQFAQQAGCGKVWLHASPAGRDLYESHGFGANGSYLEWVPR